MCRILTVYLSFNFFHHGFCKSCQRLLQCLKFTDRVTSHQTRVRLNTRRYHLTRLRILECIANSKHFGTYLEINVMHCVSFRISLYRYYALEVSYFKSSLDRKLLELLWNKYWVNTLSSSSLLTVRINHPVVHLLFFYMLNIVSMNTTEMFFSV